MSNKISAKIIINITHTRKQVQECGNTTADVKYQAIVRYRRNHVVTSHYNNHKLHMYCKKIY